jgi:hypothetical protein
MYLLNEEPIANFGGQIDTKTLAVKRGALDLLITVGLLPASRIRSQLVRSFDQTAFLRSLTVDGAATVLEAKDILLIPVTERLAFLKGVARVLAAFSGEPPMVQATHAIRRAPLAALATLVASARRERRRAFTVLDKSVGAGFEPFALGRGLTYEAWVKRLATERLAGASAEGLDFTELERLAGARLLEAIGETGQAF